MTLTATFGLGGYALLLAAGAVRLVRHSLVATHYRLAVALVVVALSVVPIAGLPALAYLRGVFGDLSVTTVALLALALVSGVSGRAGMPEGERSVLFGAVALVALAFYPLALGLGPFDPYAAGFGAPLLAGLFFAFVTAWWREMQWIAAIVLLAVAGWIAGVVESGNLWDHLLDVPLAVYALGRSASRIRARVFRSRQTQ